MSTANVNAANIIRDTGSVVITGELGALSFEESGIFFDPGTQFAYAQSEQTGVGRLAAFYLGDAPVIRLTLAEQSTATLSSTFPGRASGSSIELGSSKLTPGTRMDEEAPLSFTFSGSKINIQANNVVVRVRSGDAIRLGLFRENSIPVEIICLEGDDGVSCSYSVS